MEENQRKEEKKILQQNMTIKLIHSLNPFSVY